MFKVIIHVIFCITIGLVFIGITLAKKPKHCGYVVISLIFLIWGVYYLPDIMRHVSQSPLITEGTVSQLSYVLAPHFLIDKNAVRERMFKLAIRQDDGTIQELYQENAIALVYNGEQRTFKDNTRYRFSYCPVIKIIVDFQEVSIGGDHWNLKKLL